MEKHVKTAVLRRFALNLDRSHWPNDVGYRFYCQSRCMCNFVERALRQERLPFASSKLVITGSPRSAPAFAVNAFEVASLLMPFDIAVFQQVKTDFDRQELFIKFASQGLSFIPGLEPKTAVGLINSFSAFRAGSYVNEWQHKKRLFRTFQFTAALDCELDSSSFRLYLTVSRKDASRRRLLLTCDPDEIAFNYRFKDLLIEDEVLIVTSKQSEPLARIPVTSLFNGPIH